MTSCTHHENRNRTPRTRHRPLRRLRTVGVLLLLGLLSLGQSALAQEPDDALELGRKLTQKFYAGETDSLIGRFSDELSGAVGGAPGLRAFRDGFLKIGRASCREGGQQPGSAAA